MRLIDADALRVDFETRVKACDKWIEECAGEELKQARAIATKDFLFEVIMTIDNAPTVELQMGRMTTGYVIPVSSVSTCGSDMAKTSTNIVFDAGGHIYGVMGGDKIMEEFEKDLRGEE